MMSSPNVLPLGAIEPGVWIRIHSLPQGLLRAQFIRFGVNEGERVRCIERLPGGTIVIQKNRQQIAIGHILANRIFVVVIRQEELTA
jgi:ferrous iron transport protein A